MKTSLIVILFSLCSQILSQIDRQDNINHRDFLKERNIHSTNPLGQIELSFETNIFQDNQLKGDLDNAVLNNEFQLVEKKGQFWDEYDSNWVNMKIHHMWGIGIYGGGRQTYLHDERNNMIEYLRQDCDGTSWVNDYKRTSTYDANNIMTEYLGQFWDGTSWSNSSKYTYTYDGNNNMIERLGHNWDESNWINSSKNTCTYNINNKIIEETYQRWIEASWINEDNYKYAYDGSSNMIEYLRQDWGGTSWVNDDKRTYTFDENNNMIERLYQNWRVNETILRNYERTTYTYDENNNIIEELNQTWNDNEAIWINSHKITYTYDENNNIIEELNQDGGWDSTKWVYEDKFTYLYDANNNMIEYSKHNWDESSWVFTHEVKNTYDSHNILVEEQFQNMIEDDWISSNPWITKWRFTYVYESITNIEQLTKFIESYSLSNNYPNPFNPSTTIKYEIPKESYITLKVYDILGREVAVLVNKQQKAGYYEVDWNAENNSSGVYFYKIQAGDFVDTKKILLMK